MDGGFNNWEESKTDSLSMPFPNEKCPKCGGFGWGFKGNALFDNYEFYCPECGYDLVSEFGGQGENYENHFTYKNILDDILATKTLVDYPVLPYLMKPSIPIISSITETDGQGESILTYRDDSGEPIGYLSYHLDKINKTVGINSVWALPD